ncbi:hypothetical protein [Natrialba swarupiae]|uniref:Uncharacterized protein n=1 Tax=Natrialba swarupiae TaxID=2448032 RepID=A0A5D5AQ95_9EURY|nr:hypothetical protein [Natrialba swarupiae]TYT63234.1 hypothetical protein FYC77_03940 [Natrialba swarupiae]
MSSKRDAADADRVDRSDESVCDRCDEPVRDDRVSRLSADPCPELTDRYESVRRVYCPDCVAAVGMLEFAAGARAVSSTKPSKVARVTPSNSRAISPSERTPTVKRRTREDATRVNHR